ncbi:IclR family transcriptional regulator [Spiractinospora alimapuensis]|uniref:IclR family transcriptional regulator n=1 Tax=Spiractinospora alimapuensis TaxID=2820884 RepID=UPI001F3A0EF1|nr:IclR family transcriptional regulator [Spiractinospora alimapuensis]QVQ51587.1 IclR family transcriptional regulator [Spiractinospora alimapuensis]
MSQPNRPVTALARGLRILETLSRAEGPMGNGQLARSTGLAPSTVSRLTDSLVQLGYLRINPTSGAYFLTPKNLRLGYPVLANMSIVGKGQRVLDDLSAETGVTAALAVRDEVHVAFVATARGRGVRAVRLAVGGRLPVAVSAAGLALMAQCAEPHRSRVLRQIRSDLIDRGADVTQFDDRLARAEQEHVVTTQGAWQDDIEGLAVSLQNNGDLYALTLVMKKGHLDPNRETLTQALTTAADTLSD